MHQTRVSLLLVLLSSIPLAAQAHFQELIPSKDIVSDPNDPEITLDLTFTHPMERGPAMPMGEPVQFGVLGPQGREDLRPALVRRLQDGQPAYRASYRLKAPGDYIFYLEPAPYWESGEGRMIVHHTKVVVEGFGGGESWDAEVGSPVEIIPLTRPYGLWTGNLFRGLVKYKGQPVPFATVEVEWRNDGSVEPPADAFITQVVKTDAQGVFAYAMPRAGWWGFAALVEGDQPLKNPEGQEVPVELGGLIWVHTRDMK